MIDNTKMFPVFERMFEYCLFEDCTNEEEAFSLIASALNQGIDDGHIDSFAIYDVSMDCGIILAKLSINTAAKIYDLVVEQNENRLINVL